MSVSLVLPCYAPPPDWVEVVSTRYAELCAASGLQLELVLVIDGDPNIDADSLQYLAARIATLQIIKYPTNMGKGFATRQGVAAAKGDIVIYTDIDFPYDTPSIMRILARLTAGEVDVAAGVKDDAYYNQVPPLRRFISRLLRSMIKLFLSIPITDTQCGLKGFNSAGKAAFLLTSINRYLFDLEFIYSAFTQARLKVVGVPVSLRSNVQFRKMNYRILFPEAINFVRILLRIK